MVSRATRLFKNNALSLTFIASKLAPTRLALVLLPGFSGRSRCWQRGYRHLNCRQCCRQLCENRQSGNSHLPVTLPECRSWLASEGAFTSDIFVACATVFAGKPAPTGGWWRASRHQCWLCRPLREQARSYRGLALIMSAELIPAFMR